MCKRIVKRGRIENLVVDRSLDYIFEEIEEGEELPFLDILLVSGENIFLLVEDIISARSINSLSRIVVLPSPFQENMISSLFPYVEFIRSGKVILSHIYSGDATYRHTLCQSALTKKEEKMLPSLSYGMSDKEISLVLGISRRTVVRTKQRVIEKTGLISSSQLSVFSALKCYVLGKEKRNAETKKSVIESRYARKRESCL